MNILFTVCGRAGSKGFKNKNLKSFLGEPLVYYTLSCIDLFIKKNRDKFTIDVALNTDSTDLIKLVEKTTLNVITIIRNPELGRDDTPKVEVIRNSLEICEEKKKYKYDIIIDVDITSPMRTLFDLENVLNKKMNNNNDIVFSVVESRRNPYFNMVKEENGSITKVIKSNYVARQQAPKVFDMNASIYAYSRTFLCNKKVISVFDGNADISLMADTAILDIDSENDFELMQIIGKYLYSKNQDLKAVKDNIKNIL